MTYREARVYLDEMSKYGSVLGLDAVRELLAELGNPQDGLRFIHIAGTNGKGSVLAFVSSVLSEAGYKTGKYISPAVFSYLEKIQIDGVWISEEEFAELVWEVQKAIVRMETRGMASPTVFEMETAIAFLYFRRKNCDYVVLETGLGGRLDATNVVQNTEIAVFTTIGRDHMGMLGETLEEIAKEKAGILKPGCTAVSAAQQAEVRRVLEAQAERTGCHIVFARPEQAAVSEEDYRGICFSYPLFREEGTDGNRSGGGESSMQWNGGAYDANGKREYPEPIRIRMAGRYQLENAVTALEVVRRLPVSSEAVERGFAKAEWPGRFTCIAEDPVFLIDGAHNEDAARRLRESVETYFPGRRLFLIMGVFQDKEYRRIAEMMAPLAECMYTVDLPDQNRTLPAEELKQVLTQYCPGEVYAAKEADHAVQLALQKAEKQDVILAFGSLSYLGKVKEAVRRFCERRPETFLTGAGRESRATVR